MEELKEELLNPEEIIPEELYRVKIIKCTEQNIIDTTIEIIIEHIQEKIQTEAIPTATMEINVVPEDTKLRERIHHRLNVHIHHRLQEVLVLLQRVHQVEAAAEEVLKEEVVNLMKNLTQKILLISFIAIAFTGCYTVIWMPNENIQPTGDQNYQEDSFYPTNYYGEDYNHFYEYPWWYSLTPSTAYIQNPYSRDTSQTQFIRQRDSGRGGTGDRSGLIPTAPMRNEPSIPAASTTTTSSSSQNSSNSSNTNRVESTSSKPSTSKDNSSNNNSNAVRNNNGNRNSNGRN